MMAAAPILSVHPLRICTGPGTVTGKLPSLVQHFLSVPVPLPVPLLLPHRPSPSISITHSSSVYPALHHPAHPSLCPHSALAATIANSSQACHSSYISFIQLGFGASLRFCRPRASLGICVTPDLRCGAFPPPLYSTGWLACPRRSHRPRARIDLRHLELLHPGHCHISNRRATSTLLPSCSPASTVPPAASAPIAHSSVTSFVPFCRTEICISCLLIDIIRAIDCRSPAVSQRLHHCPALQFASFPRCPAVASLETPC